MVVEITEAISFAVTAPRPSSAYSTWKATRSATNAVIPTTLKALSSLARTRQVPRRVDRREAAATVGTVPSDPACPAPLISAPMAAPLSATTGLPVVAMVGGGQLSRMTHQAAIAL